MAAFSTVAFCQEQGNELFKVGHKMNPHEGAVPTGSTGQQLPAITNHGGPVMSGTPVVYLIWYGNWNQQNGSDTPVGQGLVNTFLGNLSGSPYETINSTYSSTNGTVTGKFTVGQSIIDSYSQGSRLSDNKVQAIVSKALTSGALPTMTNAIYFVLTSTDVSESSGFCSRYCGWHTYGTIAGSNIKYSFVGNANRCLSGCAAQTTSPNGNAGVDGMISVIAHELEEAISDPNLNAWYDSNGSENADKCAWTFGHSLSTLPNGAQYNVTLGGVNFLVQRNLSGADSTCYISLGQQ